MHHLKYSQLKYYKVPVSVFSRRMQDAIKQNSRIGESCSSPEENNLFGKELYLLGGESAGFAISETGELTHVFSVKKGFGDKLVKDAIELGAKHLDCFDGYLVGFYEKHGFKEDKREPNWTEGQPDIVYMKLN